LQKLKLRWLIFKQSWYYQMSKLGPSGRVFFLRLLLSSLQIYPLCLLVGSFFFTMLFFMGKVQTGWETGLIGFGMALIASLWFKPALRRIYMQASLDELQGRYIRSLKDVIRDSKTLKEVEKAVKLKLVNLPKGMDRTTIGLISFFQIALSGEVQRDYLKDEEFAGEMRVLKSKQLDKYNLSFRFLQILLFSLCCQWMLEFRWGSASVVEICFSAFLVAVSMSAFELFQAMDLERSRMRFAYCVSTNQPIYASQAVETIRVPGSRKELALGSKMVSPLRVDLEFLFSIAFPALILGWFFEMFAWPLVVAMHFLAPEVVEGMRHGPFTRGLVLLGSGGAASKSTVLDNLVKGLFLSLGVFTFLMASVTFIGTQLYWLQYTPVASYFTLIPFRELITGGFVMTLLILAVVARQTLSKKHAYQTCLSFQLAAFALLFAIMNQYFPALLSMMPVMFYLSFRFNFMMMKSY